jgi:predicted permease
MVATTLLDAIPMLGSLTIPLSLLAIGTQLGAIPLSLRQLPVSLGAVVLARLLVAPLVTIGGLRLLVGLGYPLPAVTRMVVVLLASMPVAIVCSVMAERYGGDARLAAQGVFLSTLFSLLTVPALFYLVS